MIISFDDIISKAQANGVKGIAVACAHDSDVLLSLQKAVDEKIVFPILIGNREIIKQKMDKLGLDFAGEIIDCKDDDIAAEISVRLVASGDAKMLMKGAVSTATILGAVLNKKHSLEHSGLLSHVGLFSNVREENLVLLTDAGINIAPTLSQKKKIIENAVSVALNLGIRIPKVAPICAIETVNEKMQATIDAASLSKMSDRGQIKNCIVDGPLGFDNAISIKNATLKGIKSEVAGRADILLAPQIETANVMYKSLALFARNEYGGVVAGAQAPIVLTSRTDPHEVKFNTIVLASVLS